MIFVRNWSENIITMSQRGNPGLELLASSHISSPQGQGLGIQLTLGGQSCMTRCHSSSWIRLCQSESPTGLFLQWTSSTFSFCLYQMGWQQISRSLAEIPCQIFFHSRGMFLSGCSTLQGALSSLFLSTLQKTKKGQQSVYSLNHDLFDCTMVTMGTVY